MNESVSRTTYGEPELTYGNRGELNVSMAGFSVSVNQDGVVSGNIGGSIGPLNISTDSYGYSVPIGPLGFGETFKADGVYGSASLGVASFRIGFDVAKDNPRTNLETFGNISVPRLEDGVLSGKNTHVLTTVNGVQGSRTQKFDLDGNLIDTSFLQHTAMERFQ